MILGNDFILFAMILLSVVILPLYIYRGKVFKAYYERKNITIFLQELQIYLKNTYPKITFDFSKIAQLKKDNKDYKILQTLIIEEYIKQFTQQEYLLETQQSIPNGNLWSTYEQNSRPPKGKSPSDLSRRKELLWMKQKKACERCGKTIKLDNSALKFIKELNEGGTYHFENMIILCHDCNKILNRKSLSGRDLLITDELMNRATF